jgi:hypothetical protein
VDIVERKARIGRTRQKKIRKRKKKKKVGKIV